MKKLNKEEMFQIAPLFEGHEDTLIWSCLEGHMGDAWCNEEGLVAQIITGDFCFFAGDASLESAKEIVAHIPKDYPRKYILMVEGSKEWGELIEQVYGEKCHSFIRYAFKKEANIFDRGKLEGFIAALPKEFSIVPIEERLYEELKKEAWGEDLCAQFKDAEDYKKRGLGFCVLHRGVPVCGASSYTIFNKGIEIEIDTQVDFRRKGLATACAAKLILTCLDQGLYPSWDAANLNSVGLAKKLGYHLSHEYTTYEVNC